MMLTTTRLKAGNWGINDWYRMHSINKTNLAGLAGKHTIREPPKCPPRQAWCSCGAILIVEDDKCPICYDE